jgi:hypothetical protein
MIGTKTSSRGQLFTGDLSIATLVFLIVLASLFFLWSSSTEDIENSTKLRDLKRMSSDVAEQLIRTTGVPEDWQPSTVRVMGLSDNSRTINGTKLLYFIGMMDSNGSEYESNKYLLGLGQYDFFLNITDIDGDPVNYSNTALFAGLLPSGTSSELIIQRTAILNESIIRFNFIVWD